jgi:hypothetical protein
MSGSKLPHSKALKCAPSGERLPKSANLENRTQGIRLASEELLWKVIRLVYVSDRSTQRGWPVTEKLLSLIEKARRVRMTPQEKEAQRISFAYGNTHYEDSRITREQVARCSLSLGAGDGSREGSRP